jgi:hypothetical protein
MNDSGSRHADISIIESYFAKGVEGLLKVQGTPKGLIVIEPHHDVLAIRVPFDGLTPSVIPFENIVVDLVNDDDSMWQQLSIHLDNNVNEVYPVLCAVLDRIQVGGETFASAVDATLSALAEIVALRRGLSLEQQIGLVGELLFLTCLVVERGSESALAAWQGPQGEEHDFGLAEFDVEVKVTLGERRTHWISGLSQLVPTGLRPLYVFSVQLTRANPSVGWTLPDLIDQVRQSPVMAVSVFDGLIHQVGYRSTDSDLYRSSWSLRTVPAFFAVDADFPVISPSLLKGALKSPERVIDVRYRIDLTGLTPSNELLPLTALNGK